MVELLFVVIGMVAIWANWIGHDPRAIYSSRAPFLKFYGYPLWNGIAFFSFGLLPYKSWRKEYEEMLRQERHYRNYYPTGGTKR